MRTVFRTNNIDCSSRWSTPFDTLGPLVTGFYSRAPLEDVIGNDCVLVVGGNVTEENPVTEYLLRDGARRRQTGLLMLSARPSRLDADARAVVRVPPGGEAAGLAAVVAGLVAAAGQALPGDVLADIGAAIGGPAAAAGSDEPDRLAARAAGRPERHRACQCRPPEITDWRARRCSSSTTCCRFSACSARTWRCSSSSTVPTSWAPGIWGFCRRRCRGCARSPMMRRAQLSNGPGAPRSRPNPARISTPCWSSATGGGWARSILPEATP